MSTTIRNLAGQQFGNLLIVGDLGPSSNGEGHIWICNCSCGNVTSVPAKRLRAGRVKSCGCLWQATKIQPGTIAHNKGLRLPRVKERARLFVAGLPIYCPRHGEHSEWIERKQPSHTFPVIRCARCGRDDAGSWIRRNYLHVLARNTRRRDKASEIDEEFLILLLERQHNRCALSGVEFDANHKPSVDRLDSNLGYTKANTHLVIFDINRMKTDLPLDLFLLRCKQVVNYAVHSSTS